MKAPAWIMQAKARDGALQLNRGRRICSQLISSAQYEVHKISVFEVYCSLKCIACSRAKKYYCIGMNITAFNIVLPSYVISLSSEKLE